MASVEDLAMDARKVQYEAHAGTPCPTLASSEDKMVIDGWTFTTCDNGCVWIEGMQVYRFWESHIEQKDAIIAAWHKYAAATASNREADRIAWHKWHNEAFASVARAQAEAEQWREDFDNQ